MVGAGYSVMRDKTTPRQSVATATLCCPIVRVMGTQVDMLTLINPVERAEQFDHADWLFEVKFDGFRAAATASAAG
jgi:ATP-dependent DNA ligase